MPGDEFVNISQPNLMQTGPLEIGESELEHSKGLLEVSGVPEEVSEIK
jgi:hypothetical protein